VVTSTVGGGGVALGFSLQPVKEKLTAPARRTAVARLANRGKWRGLGPSQNRCAVSWRRSGFDAVFPPRAAGEVLFAPGLCESSSFESFIFSYLLRRCLNEGEPPAIGKTKCHPASHSHYSNPGWQVHARAGQVEKTHLNAQGHVVFDEPIHASCGSHFTLESVRCQVLLTHELQWIQSAPGIQSAR
jgi:hypothetical protein